MYYYYLSILNVEYYKISEKCLLESLLRFIHIGNILFSIGVTAISESDKWKMYRTYGGMDNHGHYRIIL